MATRTVDTAIRYALTVTENGLKAAIGLTTDLGKQSKATETAVATSQKAIQAQYKTLESIAVKADQSVAKSAIDCSTVVNKALDAQIAKLRDTGTSYSAIMAQQRAMGASAAELAASIKRSSESEIASMQAVRAEADRTVRQRLSTAASGLGSRVTGAAAGLAGAVGSGSIAALGITGALAYTGLEKSRSVTEGTLAIRGSTGLPTNQALALATIATSLGIAPRSIGQAFGTLGGQTTKALAGSASAGANFSALGISRATVAQNVDNPLALFDLVTSRAAALPATQQAAVQRSLLGRGSSIVGQLTAGGPLTTSVGEVEKNLPGLDPKKLIAMQEAFVHLKEVSTAFELSFAQAFGPSIGAGLNAITPLLPRIAAGFKDAFGFIKGVVDGPVGQALGKFGQMAYDAGKKLVEAFKPAEPFFQNVLLPLIKGIAIGIGIGLIGAINLVTAGVKILAPAFGALGNVLAPLKTVIQDVGTVLGIVFSGDALGAVFKGVSAVVGEIPLLGKAFEFILEPINVAGKAISGIYDVLSGTFGKIFDFLPGVGPEIGRLLGTVAAAVLGAFAAIPDVVGGLASDFGKLGASVVDWIVTGIQSIPDAITKAIVGLLPAPIQGAASGILGAVAQGVAGAVPGLNLLGLKFNQGGLVPAMVSPGEMIVHGGMAATVPGPRTAADSVFAMLPAGAAVMTGHGQALMGMGASLDQALAMQMPHFSAGGTAGGTVNALGWNVPAPKGSRGSSGPKATMRYVNNLPVGLMTTAEWQAYKHAHAKTKTVAGQDLGQFVATAYGPPWGGIEGGGITATGVDLTRGQADYIVAVDPSVIPLHSKLQINPNPFGNANIVFKAEDTGGAIKGNRLDFYDWKGRADQNAWGRKSVDVRSATGLSVTSTAGLAKATAAPTLSNLIASLTGQTAFAGGYQAGLAGNTLSDTLRSGVLSSLIGDVAITKSGLVGGTQPTGTSSLSGAGAYTGRLGAMIAKAGEIAGHNYPYLWGGGHNASFSPPYDCSGAVSAVLHAGGALKSPLVSGDLMHWGQPGRGQNVSIFSSPTHTFMQLAGRYFGTSGSNPGGGANWIAKFPENMPAITHPPGMRRGGIAGFGSGGGFQAGGVAGAPSYTQTYYRNRFGKQYRGFYLWGKYGHGIPSNAQGVGGHLYKNLSIATMSDAWNAYWGQPQQASAVGIAGVSLDTFWNKWEGGQRFRAGGVAGKTTYPASYYRGRFGNAYRGFYLWRQYGKGHGYQDDSWGSSDHALASYFGVPYDKLDLLPQGVDRLTFHDKWGQGDHFQTGGVVGKGLSFQPKVTKRVNPLSAPLGLVGSLLGRDDSTDVSSIVQAIAAQLDDVHAQTLQSLISLASNLAKHSTKGLDTIQQRRLSTALNLVDAAIGNRIGLAVAGAQNTVDAIARGNAHKVAMATLAGVDPSSALGLAQVAQLDKLTVQGLNAQVGTLNQALATAKKYGDKATIKDVTDKLNTALAALDTASVQALTDWKAAIEKVTQDAVDASGQAVSLAQGGQQILSLQQQLAGTDQTPAAGQQTADYIRNQVIPQLQKQYAATQADAAAAGSVGDQAKVQADQLAAQQQMIAILTAQLDAQNAIKNTSAAAANALKQAGGQLAFNFNGEAGFTDRLTAVLVGT